MSQTGDLPSMNVFPHSSGGQSWRLSVSRVGSFGGREEESLPAPSPGFWCFTGDLWCLVSMAYRPITQKSPWYVCVCPNFYFHKDPSHIGLGPILLQYDFIKPVIPIRACFQIRSPSESLGNLNTWIVFQPMNACMHAPSVASVMSDSLQSHGL